MTQKFDPDERQHHAEKFTPAQIMAALEKSAGIRKHAADLLGTSRSTVARYISNYPWLRERLNDLVEARLDEAESTVVQLMRSAASEHTRLNASTFLLRTLGKGRGYVIRSEVAGRDGGPVEFRPNLDHFTDRELDALEALLQKASGLAAPATTDRQAVTPNAPRSRSVPSDLQL